MTREKIYTYMCEVMNRGKGCINTSEFIKLIFYSYLRLYIVTGTTKGKSQWCSSYMLDRDIIISEFELQSRYNVPFQTNTLEKSVILSCLLHL